ncbi:M56 family metallopeptidase [Erythrobacter alti]|uniref:M56 family metallopeptidase n=1 Tax=Erythrobacter alti TaxID=1896145 RepID=UPI0030F3FB6E
MTGLQSLLPNFALTDWMVDTFIYTGLLIAIVLVMRRTVAQHFGPQVAYALWALPLLRLVMPPIVLPAWMAPAEPATAPEAAASTAAPLLVIISEVPAAAGEAAAAAAPAVGVTVTDLLFPLWLLGAAIFLGWRTREYVTMRRDLLADARPMGEAGKVRLVETPAVSAPVAFGIRDKVVALPEGFMALIDVKARDMAIAHELEHHRGHDLLANIAAQPLLALHWFNPLAWWGWRAMRRDQEAACDARVVAGRARSERAAYAEVIAGFAAGEHLALAAPMACPVLGEKSIIHRLRSLTLTDISTRRRRIGIAAITTTALALPLTASITYAQPPAQQQDADAPAIESVDPDEAHRVVRIERHVEGDHDGEHDIDIEEIEDGERVIVRTVEDEDGERRVVRRVIRRGGPDGEHAMSEAEIEAMLAEVERGLEGMEGEIENRVELALRHRARAAAMGQNVFVVQEGEEGSHNINVRCDDDQTVAQQELSDGRTAMVICHTAIQAHAAAGLRSAIASIQGNDSIPAETRREILRELERAIAEMERSRAEIGRVSMRFTPPAPPAPPKATRVRANGRNVSFSFAPESAIAQAVRFNPMVHPLTGRPVIEEGAEDDCDEDASRTNA